MKHSLISFKGNPFNLDGGSSAVWKAVFGMLHNWSGDEEERFPFWSGMEIVRVGVIAGLAIVPVSVSAIDAPASRPKPAPIQREIKAGFQTGRLLSTRQVEFDVRALDLTSLGDRDPDVVR